MDPVLRIVDANGNRAREALRVMEEAARFVLNDAELSSELKQMRHALRTSLDRIPGLIASRDTPGDVGTDISTQTETKRRSVRDVTTAAGKRLSEALRAIEEYAKTISPTAAGEVERLRYRGYDVERRLALRLGAQDRPQWCVCVLLTESLCTRPWREVAQGCIEGGADCIQLREKTLAGGELLTRARLLVEQCQPKGVAVVVNDRPDIALLSGADGVHIGQRDLPAADVRAMTFGRCLMGVSTSCIDEARAAIRAGADYCGVGPMFATTTKDKKVIVGPAYLREFVERFPDIPHLAIGGITPDNVGELHGAAGVAVSSVVCGADDPAGVVAAFTAAVERADDAPSG
ncbi:MAG: thiamine phosphate synthase [Phycisphaerales bacterium]|nr:thiamine phosphate synthase [Phycisphaerales bacterium]